MSKLALKRLTASDLTLFEWHFRNRNAGNQKAINLNADVFVQHLFPALPELAPSFDGRLPVDLFLYGPAFGPELNLQRKVIKFGTYKNWRLDGEMIYNPVDSPSRFNILVEGDIAVFEFNEGAIPTRARVVFLAQNHASDAQLHAYLNSRLGTRSMVAISEADLGRDISVARVAEGHPIHELALEPDLEDAALGGFAGAQLLRRRRSGRKVLRSELLEAKRHAEQNGQLGEEFVNAHFQSKLERGEIRSFVWESADNAVAPYDFKLEDLLSRAILVDVKATAGDFERPIHISLSELEEMAAAPNYELYRVYSMSEGTACLRVATDLSGFARGLLRALNALPSGVSLDAISVKPETLHFGAQTMITRDTL